MLWKYKRIYSESPIEDGISDEMAIISTDSSASTVGVCAYTLVDDLLVEKNGATSGVIEVTDKLLNSGILSYFDGMGLYWKVSWYTVEYTLKVDSSGVVLEVIYC